MSRTPARQDFIARMRYKNALPPPPCRSKLIDINLDLDEYTKPEFLSRIVQNMRQPINMEIDRELGMPLDLTELGPGVFLNDESAMIGGGKNVKLDPKDEELLVDADSTSDANGNNSGHIRAMMPEVSFLRRTEYISNEAIKQARVMSAVDGRLANLVEQPGLEEDAVEQVRLIEESMNTKSDLQDLKHPIKKGLKAVDSWDFIPELQLLDLNYLVVKLTGSAPGQQKDVSIDSRLETAIYRPTTTEYGDDYVSYYLASEEDSHKLRQDKSTENTSYLFRHIRDYDMELRQYIGSMDEIAITFDDKLKRANFVPIMGRTNLKRRRVLSINKQAVNEAKIDAIDLSIRDPTSEEIAERNAVRHAFDPRDYPLPDEGVPDEAVPEEDVRQEEEEGEEALI